MFFGISFPRRPVSVARELCGKIFFACGRRLVPVWVAWRKESRSRGEREIEREREKMKEGDSVSRRGAAEGPHRD